MTEGQQGHRTLFGFDTAGLISSTAIGHIALDRQWRIVDANAAAAELLGLPADVPIDQILWELYPGTRNLNVGRALESVMSTERPASFEVRRPDSDTWFELRVQPTEIGIACYFLDITSRKVAFLRARCSTSGTPTSRLALQILLHSLRRPRLVAASAMAALRSGMV